MSRDPYMRLQDMQEIPCAKALARVRWVPHRHKNRPTPAPHFYQVDGESLMFDHTVFRDPGGTLIHAFRRFRPAFARGTQGAVRSIPNPDQAWSTFQSAMLEDIKFETR
ncbi:MAG: hypothetical protein WCS43_19040 [Verrucomicrobiota bacterium]